MQIQSLTAFSPKFTGSRDIMPVPNGSYVKLDEGQPFLVTPLNKDTFQSRVSPEISKAIETREPGYRPEDFLY